MRVLVILEDARFDRFIVEPVVQRIFKDLGRAVQVEIFDDPRLRGVDSVCKAEEISKILQDRGRFFELFLLIVDRDCKPRERLIQERESEHPSRLIACLAIEEVEVWMLALHREKLAIRWSEVQRDCHPKGHAEAFLKQQVGWEFEPGRGRKRAMRELGAAWKGLLQLCGEIDQLKVRIARWLQGPSNT